MCMVLLLNVFFLRCREFINYMKRSRTFYASIAERLCEGDLVMKDSSTCWNGEDVVER